jgi:hypothetical protein
MEIKWKYTIGTILYNKSNLYFFLKGNISPRIIVQGGAYRSMQSDKKEVYKRTTKESARKGYDILRV